MLNLQADVMGRNMLSERYQVRRSERRVILLELGEYCEVVLEVSAAEEDSLVFFAVIGEEVVASLGAENSH